ncbi:MAG TPA: aminodeoxychorismate synthase component I [Longimicrobiales bacterium]|nr:aminodeoxychorismate synthase component I [Longimicrobiales bacterium]
MVQNPAVILDFAGVPRRVFSNPIAVLEARTPAEVRSVLSEAEKAARNGLFAAGFVAYEAAPAFDSAFAVKNPTASIPLAWFAVYEKPDETVDHRPVSPGPSVTWLPSTAREVYESNVERIREEIGSGHTYQVNLTTMLHSAFNGDAHALYESLRSAQGGGYHAFISAGDFSVVCVSPELFFEVNGRRIRTKPMKGTRTRGRWIEEDEALADELAASEKDRAENLMIVDLLRNDLGRVAEYGSVNVDVLYDLEKYRTVHQMTSTISAELRRNTSLVDVFTALFPCGSVTGAPKVAAMRLISELEDNARGVYCGAIGLIEPGGSATFNVGIRTVVVEHRSQTAWYGTGAGITFDSNAREEYEEIVAKSAVLTEAWPDFELLETMCFNNGEIARLDRHLRRMARSAQYFDYMFDEDEAHRRLGLLDGGPLRVRLLSDRSGKVRVESESLTATGDAPLLALAKSPINARDRFLFHKTTLRTTYERARMDSVWDVLLWNDAGEITEFTRGNVVADIAGELVTPPLSCGLLPGVMREELIEHGTVIEQTIPVDQLKSARRLWFINSLRGWIEVRLS